MKRQFRRRTRRATLLPVAFPIAGLSILAFVSPAVAQDNVPQPPNQAAPQPPAQAGSVIDEIRVEGNKNLNEFAIISFSGHKVGEPYNVEILDDMRTRLFQSGNFGYATNPESVQVKGVTLNGKNVVTISVEENAAFKADAIEITGSGPIPPEEIRALVTRTPVYNPITFEKDALEIQRLYEKRGFIAAVLPDNNFDPETGILRVPVLVTRVAEIVIARNKKTRRQTILREMRTKENDYYNRQQFFVRDRQAIYNMNLFEDVIPEERDLGPGRIGLTLSVPEQRSGNVLVGVGFSNRAQLIGFADISENNFRGRAETVSLRWETGGAVGRNSVIGSYTNPWFDKRRTSLSVQAYDQVVYRFANRLSSAGTGSSLAGTDNRYNEQRTGGTVTVSRPFGDNRYRAALSLRGENVRPDPLGIDANTDARILQNGPIISLGGSLIRNTRDIDLDPIRGGLDQISLQVGAANLKPVRLSNGSDAPGALGNVTFSKFTLDFRRFFSLAGQRDPIRDPFGLKTALALRLFMATSVGRLPFFEQNFLGGAESLRGYREDRFWGSNAFLLSAELRQPLARSLKGVLFVDIGSAWGGLFEDVNLQGFTQTNGFNPHLGFGAGLRVVTPIGPLRLDFGYGDEGGRTHFSIGQTF